jgi:hypothetical protein
VLLAVVRRGNHDGGERQGIEDVHPLVFIPPSLSIPWHARLKFWESLDQTSAFHHTLWRDYLAGADLRGAAVILAQLPRWIADYNHFAPHAALGMRNPVEYRQALEIVTL